MKEDITSETALFFGDSHVSKWKLSYYFPDFGPINKGQNGAKINDIYLEIDQMDTSGAKAVIVVGTNNLIDCLNGLQSETDIIVSYQQLMALVSERFNNVLVVGLLPLGTQFSDNPGYPLIYQHLSEEFRFSAESFPNITVIDITDLKSDRKYLLEYYTQDGVHLNNYGYSVLSSKTRDALAEIY